MTTDQIAEQIGWLDEIITHPDNATLFDHLVRTYINMA